MYLPIAGCVVLDAALEQVGAELAAVLEQRMACASALCVFVNIFFFVFVAVVWCTYT